MKTILFLLCSFLFVTPVFPMGSKTPEGLSLLLVPAKPALVQLGMDMAAKKHALLVTYAPDTDADLLFMHIWDGNKWLRVPQPAFESGSFVKNRTSSVLVVGEESPLTAGIIAKALLWSPEVLHLESTNVTELINQMGRLYEFGRKDWEWIASRYDLQLEDLNQGRQQSSWYDQNKASDLPPSEKPWKKHTAPGAPQPPETSLAPLMPPEVLPAEEVTEKVEIIEIEEVLPEESAPADFSLEVE